MSPFGISHEAAQALVQKLSRRQREVAGLYVQGMRRREIARLLGLSVKSVDVHLFEVRFRLECESAGIARVWFAALVSEESS